MTAPTDLRVRHRRHLLIVAAAGCVPLVASAVCEAMDGPRDVSFGLGLSSVLIWTVGLALVIRRGWPVILVPLPAAMVSVGVMGSFTADIRVVAIGFVVLGLLLLFPQFWHAYRAVVPAPERLSRHPSTRKQAAPVPALPVRGGPMDGAGEPAAELDEPAHRFPPLDPYGLHFFVGPGRPLGPLPAAGAKPRRPADDPTVGETRDGLVRTILLTAGRDNPATVSVPAFFTGNGDRASIGPSRAARHPGLSAIHRELATLESTLGVDEVTLELHPLAGQSFDDGTWPKARRVRLLTTLPLEDLLPLCSSLDCVPPWTDGTATFADDRPAPDRSRVVSLSWE